VTEQRLLQETAAAQSAEELHALMPYWCAWLDSQSDGPALEAAMDRVHDAFDARLDALDNADL
jgi:hypothetical protein